MKKNRDLFSSSFVTLKAKKLNVLLDVTASEKALMR